MTRVLYGTGITDMETCYKLIRLDLLVDMHLEASRFDIEPEITARLLRRGVAIHEMPIDYEARTHDDGKKIGWRDGVCLLRCVSNGTERHRITGSTSPFSMRISVLPARSPVS